MSQVTPAYSFAPTDRKGIRVHENLFQQAALGCVGDNPPAHVLVLIAARVEILNRPLAHRDPRSTLPDLCVLGSARLQILHQILVCN